MVSVVESEFRCAVLAFAILGEALTQQAGMRADEQTIVSSGTHCCFFARRLAEHKLLFETQHGNAIVMIPAEARHARSPAIAAVAPV